jgi:hypothetical protein
MSVSPDFKTETPTARIQKVTYVLLILIVELLLMLFIWRDFIVWAGKIPAIFLTVVLAAMGIMSMRIACMK